MELIGCFGLTEPDFGSDATSLQTRAVACPGGVRLTGQKRWIGNATYAGLIVVWAIDDSSGKVRGYLLETGQRAGVGGGPVRRSTTVPGLRIEKIERKAALRCTQNADIYLDAVFVPEANIMPTAADFRRGVGLPQVLESSRLVVAWLPVGVSMGVYDAALRYLHEREQFGVPLSSMAINQVRCSPPLAAAIRRRRWHHDPIGASH